MVPVSEPHGGEKMPGQATEHQSQTINMIAKLEAFCGS